MKKIKPILFGYRLCCFAVLALAGTAASAQTLVDGAAFVSQSVPPDMVAGKIYPVSVTMKNVGTTLWTPAAHYRLAARNAASSRVFGNDTEVLMPVPPGSAYTFVMNVVAPAKPVDYRLDWGMRRGVGAWFGTASARTAASPLAAPAVQGLATLGTAVSEQYEYDALGRLIKVRVDGTVKTDYKYDKAGNRAVVTE